jgi:large subunit ribosomal protein L19
MRGAGTGRTFTVRRVVAGEGVERLFPLHSPAIVDVKVAKRGKVRRAKLYYLRERVGKATKVKESLEEVDKTSRSGKRGKRRVEVPGEAPEETPPGTQATDAPEKVTAAEK